MVNRLTIGFTTLASTVGLVCGSLIELPFGLTVFLAANIVLGVLFLIRSPMSPPVTNTEVEELAQTTDQTDDDLAIEQPLSELCAGLSKALQLESQMLTTELNRGCSLINSGASGMSEAFYRLQALTDIQHAMIEQYHINEEASDVVLDLANQLSSSQACAIKSLQFEDITTQSLQSMLHNINKIQQIATMLAGLADSTEPVMQEIQALQTVLITETDQAIQSSDHRTVTQHNMDEGAVELF